jgi:hypothetical protein
MDIVCWPTLLVLGPDGLVLAEFRGETQANSARLFITHAMKFYSNVLNPEPVKAIQITVQVQSTQSFSNINALSFPSKICLDTAGATLFISDSGNNRIIGVNPQSGEVTVRIGSGQIGSTNGSFESATFDWPQGLAFDDEKLYVADTFNDLIRVVDLRTRQVSTLCGVSNKQDADSIIGTYDYTGGGKSEEQRISSPWDVCVLKERGGLVIACAGTHQIWMYADERNTG